MASSKPPAGALLDTSDVALLGDDTIHAVTNPRRTFTGAIRSDRGDITLARGRSEWEEPGFTEVAYDFERTRQSFELANCSSFDLVRTPDHAAPPGRGRGSLGR